MSNFLKIFYNLIGWSFFRRYTYHNSSFLLAYILKKKFLLGVCEFKNYFWGENERDEYTLHIPVLSK